MNFGHTVGHSVEKLMDFKWLHGECVALGSIAAAAISRNKGFITEETFEDIKNTIELFHLPTKIEHLDPENILLATKSDKKMDGGKVKFILLRTVGNAFIDRELSDQEILDGMGACL